MAASVGGLRGSVDADDPSSERRSRETPAAGADPGRDGSPAPPPSPAPEPAGQGVLLWPWATAVLAGAVLVGVVHLVTSSGAPLVFGGDQAVLALQVHAATRFHATLGPYSRFGWSHLGPALFYLFAPAYAASGGNPWALLVDSLLLNGAALCLTVAVVRRFAGEWAARWTLVPVGLVAVALGALSFATLWNPNLEGAAVLLLSVLAAAACTGSGPSVVGVALVGTYLVQTDIGTVPIVGVSALCAVVGYSASRIGRWSGARRPATTRVHVHSSGGRTHRDPAPGDPAPGAPAPGVRTTPGTRTTLLPRWGPWAVGGVGATLVVVAWIPPVVQQLTGHPGNISRLIHFFTSHQAGPGTAGSNHSLAQAWHVVANTVSVVPFGPVPTTAVFTAASAGRQAVLVVSLAASVVAVAGALWRRNAFALGLGVTSLVGLPVSVLAAMRIVGPAYSYLMLWAVFVPVPAWIALGILAGSLSDAGARRRHSTPGQRLGASLVASAVLVVPIVLFAHQLATVPWDGAGPDRQIPAIASYATSRMDAGSTRSVVLVIGNADRWPVVAGVMLQLTDQGYRPEVQAPWEFLFTQRLVAGTGPHAELVFTDPPAPGAPAPPSPAAHGSPTLVVDGPWGPTAVRYLPPPSPAPGAAGTAVRRSG